MSTDYQNHDQSTNKKYTEYKRFAKIPDFIAENPNISSLILKVYVYLKMLDPCYPSISKIVEKTGLSSSTVKRSIKWLLENNVIDYEKGDSRRSNRYYFTEIPLDTCDRRDELSEISGATQNHQMGLIEPSVGSIRTISRATQNHQMGPIEPSDGSNRPTNTIKLIVQSNITSNTKENIQKKNSHTSKNKPKKAKRIKKQSDDSVESSGVSPQEIMDLWNKVIDQKGQLSRVRVIGDKEKRDIARTTKTLFKTISDWDLYFHSLYRSKFLLGQTGNNWRVSFDWAIMQKNATKVFNGNYFDSKGSETGLSDETKRALRNEPLFDPINISDEELDRITDNSFNGGWNYV